MHFVMFVIRDNIRKICEWKYFSQEILNEWDMGRDVPFVDSSKAIVHG